MRAVGVPRPPVCCGAGVYGQQLWNYFSRSYPEIVEAYYPAE